MDWGPRLPRKEEARWAPEFFFLDSLTEDARQPVASPSSKHGFPTMMDGSPLNCGSQWASSPVLLICQSNEESNWCKHWRPKARGAEWADDHVDHDEWSESVQWRAQHGLNCYPCLRLSISAVANLIHFLNLVPVGDVLVVEDWETSCLTNANILSNS